MLSKYFKFKIKQKNFIQNIELIMNKLKNKKVIICGEAEGFLELNRQYHFDTNFDIVAFVNLGKKKKMKIRTITPEQIPEEKFDAVLITGEDAEKVYNKISFNNSLDNIKVEKLFFEKIQDGKKNLEFLLKNNFEKRITVLKRKLKNKRVILYGAGVFFELINEYFDLSGINIIAITDKRFKDTVNVQEFCGYKVCKHEQMKNLKPDVILISLKRFVPAWEDLHFHIFKKTKISIKCIFKLSFFNLLCEIADT